MSVQILKKFLMIFVLAAFSAGCAPKVIYEVKEVKIPVPVSCKVEHPVCDNTKSTDTELITEGRLCIRRYKDALSACQ